MLDDKDMEQFPWGIDVIPRLKSLDRILAT